MKTFTQLPATEPGSLEWLEQRNTGLGSSDCSTIFGMSGYESPYSLWLKKTGRAPLEVPVSDELQNLRDMGHAMEPVIRDLAAQRLGVTIEKDDRALANVDRPWQHFNPDGMTTDGTIFEAKNVHWMKRHEWEGQVSDHAELQVHHGAAVTGATHAIVAALIAGNDLRVTTLEINPRVVEMINEEESIFWQYVAEDKEPPLDAHVRTMESITREWAHHKGAVDVATVDVQQWITQYHEAHAAEKEAQQRKREAQAHLAKILNGHDRLVDGKRVLASARRTRMSAERLKTEHPDVWKKYTTTATVFDTDRFKEEQPDMYRAYQGVTILPSQIGA